MNKMLVAVFDTEQAANAGLQALHKLHAQGDITLYACGVLAKDADGRASVKSSPDGAPAGVGVGLAVGALIGLLAGPLGMVIGAVTGSVAGAVRDYWIAGVGLDFVEQADKHLLPGKVALVAEIEEEWVIPVDSALQALGGQVFRRSRSELAEAQYDHDIVAFKAEISALESEASHASGAAKAALAAKLVASRTSLDAAVDRARQRVATLKQEAEAKADSLKAQLGQAQGDVRSKIEERVKHVKRAYHARGAKLSQAWELAKDALAV